MTQETRPGLFITLEGVEGAGKSTQCKNIQTQLESAGISVLSTREPGGTELAEGIRNLLLDPDLEVGPKEELLLMFAARASHLNQKILPALEAGQWVLCDRFTDASYAYQGAGRGIDVAVIAGLESFIQDTLRPDVTLIFDLPVAEGLSRAKSRSEQDRFELEEVAFFERIRQAYLDRAEQNESRQYEIINASASLDEVTQQVSAVVTRLTEAYCD